MLIIAMHDDASPEKVKEMADSRKKEIDDICQEGEEWRPIGSSSNDYVSNFGRIKCYPQIRNNQGKTQLHFGGLVSQIPDYKGDPYFSTLDSGYMSVAKAVADAFLVNPYHSTEVYHIDGNPTNNHINNLIWIVETKRTGKLYRADTGESFESVQAASASSGISKSSIYTSLKTGKAVKGVIWKKCSE